MEKVVMQKMATHLDHFGTIMRYTLTDLCINLVLKIILLNLTWLMFKVEFVGSEIFGPELHYLTAYKGNGQLTWPEKYTGDEWPGTKFFKVKSIYKAILFLLSSKNIFQVMSNNCLIICS